MTGLKKIAENAGVCFKTAALVLNGKYKGRTEKSREIMRRVREEARRLNYKPNNAARALRTSSTGLIGVVIEEGGLKTHPVFTEALQGANEILKENGYVLTITSLNGLEENTLDARIFKERLLDGVLVFDSQNEQSVRKILKTVPNCVLVNCNTWLSKGCVRRDEYAAGRLAGRELKRLGYKKAFYFEPKYDDEANMSSHHYSLGSRKNGFLQGFRQKDAMTSIVKIDSGDIPSWFKTNQNLLSNDSVVVAGRNLQLFCIVSSLSQVTLRAGVDFGLVSLDDEIGLLASFPNVSRVSFPRMEIGRIAAGMIIRLLNGDKSKCSSLEIEGVWIPGDTTRRLEPLK